MSKIARVFHLNKEIQKIYKNGVLQKLFFDWKKYIGQEINIEYARGYCSNRININGKVYQNLASKLYIGAGNTLMPTGTKALEPNGYTHIKLPYALKPNTSYTIVIDVVQPSEEHAFQLRNAKMEYLTLTIPTLTNKLVKGMNAATFTTSSNEISAILIKNAQNSTKDLIIKNNVIVIEGDLSGETIIEDSIKYLEEGTFVPENRIIEGKTYQNLLTNKIDYTFSGSAFYYNKTTLNNGAIYTRNNEEITSEVYGTYITLKCHKVASMLKSNTTYTLAFNIESTFSDYKGITVSGENDCFFKSSTSESNGTRYFHNESFDLSTGYKKIMFETNSNITQYFGFGFPRMQSQSEGTYLKITNIILLEGDYTSIDLPDNINGIESVGEGEIEDNNLISEMIVGWCNIETGNLEGCPESYPNSKVSNLIEINPNIKYKSNILSKAKGETTGTDNLRIRCFDENKNYIKVAENTYLRDFNDFYNYKDIYIKTKYIRILVLNSSLEVEEPYLVKENINRFNYPVTIRNYNYQCETDGVVLPNGVKNSIETIDDKKVHVQRVEKIIVTKQKDITKFNTSSNIYGYRLYFINSDIYGKKGRCSNAEIGVISNKFIGIADGSWNSSKEVNCCFMNINGVVHFLVDETEFPNRENFNDWLGENEVIVYYPLAEPIYTYLESGLYDDITLPDGTKNEISYNGENHIHIRNIGKIVLDGSNDEEWGASGLTPQTETIIFQTAIIANTVISNSSLLCDIYGTLPDLSTDNIEGIIMGGTNNARLYVRIKRSNLETEDINGFKAYLSENPLEVYYELAEPVITELYYNDIAYKLNEPLRSLPDGVCDTIEEGKIVKRVEKVIVESLDNLNVILQEANNNRIGIKFGNENNSSVRQPIISDNFFDLSSATSNTSGGAFLGGGRLYLTLGLSTIEEYNNWFKNNPTTFYYQLNPPTETEITPDMILTNGESITDTTGTELPNGVKDIIEEGYYIKRVGKVTYNGQEDWKTSQASTNVLVFYLNNTNFKELSSLICDTYTVGATSKDKSIYCGNAWRPQIRDDSCTTVEEFKQLLSENPVTVWYELATPVKIPLFLIKEGLNTLKSTNNITPQLELDCLVRDDFQNLCDNIWESGDIAVDSGVEYSSSTSRIKLQDYIAVQPNTTYYCDTSSETVYSTTGKIGVRYYKNDKTFISGGGIGIAKTSYNKFTTPEDCYYIKFIVETLDTNYKMYLRPVK